MNDVTRVVRRRSTTGIHVAQLAGTMAVAIALGGLVGGAAIAVDHTFFTPPPIELGGIESTRSLLAGVAGGLITVAVFSLWMRTVVVGLVSDQFSPRTLATFLEDRFQRHLLGAMAAGLVAVLVVLMGLPEESTVLAPMVGTLLSVLIAIAALAGVLAAIQHATRSLSVPELVSRLANEALEVLERQPAGAVELAPHAPAAPESAAVLASATGWVTAIDTRAMIEAVPPRAVVRLRTRVGAFVTPRSRVATVSLPEEVGTRDGRVPELDVEAISGAVTLARTRTPDVDLALALGQLLDVGVHALQGSVDTATGHEVLVHLGAVLEAVVERGVPLRHDTDDEEERWVIDEAGWEAADHLQLCVERLRDAAAREPESARHLLQMLGRVREVAQEVDDRAVVSEVGRQVETVMALVDGNGVLPRDRQRLQREADAILG